MLSGAEYMHPLAHHRYWGAYKLLVGDTRQQLLDQPDQVNGATGAGRPSSRGEASTLKRTGFGE
jgi:hypothetical protein